jgi:hypothetical protein
MGMVDGNMVGGGKGSDEPFTEMLLSSCNMVGCCVSITTARLPGRSSGSWRCCLCFAGRDRLVTALVLSPALALPSWLPCTSDALLQLLLLLLWLLLGLLLLLQLLLLL